MYAGAAKYIPILSKIKLIPYPSISFSELILTWFRIDNEVRSGVMATLTVSLNIGFCRSKSAIVGLND